METRFIKDPVSWISDDEVDPGFVPLEAEPFIIRQNGETLLHIGDGVTENGHLVARQSPNVGGGVISDRINRPEIVTPVNNATDITTQPLITSGQYVGSGSAAGTEQHAASHWQIATDVSFVNLVVDTGRDLVSLNQLDLEAKGITLTAGPHYVRVRYESVGGILSDWSNVSAFTVTAPQYAIGDVVNGNIVAGETELQWAMVAPATSRAELAWGLDGQDLPTLEFGDVQSLTVEAGNLGSPAAAHCQSLGMALPNPEVLQLIHDNAAAIDAADTSGGTLTITSLIQHPTGGYGWSIHTVNGGNGFTSTGYFDFTTNSPQSTTDRAQTHVVIPVIMMDK